MWYLGHVRDCSAPVFAVLLHQLHHGAAPQCSLWSRWSKRKSNMTSQNSLNICHIVKKNIFRGSTSQTKRLTTPRGSIKLQKLEYPLRCSRKNVELASSSTFFLEQSSWSWRCLAMQNWSGAAKIWAEQSQTPPKMFWLWACYSFIIPIILWKSDGWWYWWTKG